MDFSSPGSWDDTDVWGTPSTLRNPPPTTKRSTSDDPFGQDNALPTTGNVPSISPHWGDATSSGLHTGVAGLDVSEEGDIGVGAGVSDSPELMTPKPLQAGTIPPLLSADFGGAGPSGSGQMDEFEEDIQPSAGASKDQAGQGDGFDDFGDFDEGAGPAGGDDDDEFGGFDAAPPPSVHPPRSIPFSSEPLRPLVLPPRSSIRSGTLSPLIAPLVPALFPASSSAAVDLTDEPERQVGGLGQVLVTEELRTLWKEMVSSGGGGAARTKGSEEEATVEWKRSRVRRDFLVNLGVPVDLNDFLKPAKPLAKISLSLDPAVNSASGPSSAGPHRSRGPSPSSRPPSRPGSVAPRSGPSATPSPHPPFGKEPTLDRERCREILSMSEGQFTLQTPAQLSKLREELEGLTVSASELLTRKLQVREQHVSDGETYNAMISDLVSAAQKIKTSSGVQRSGSMSTKSSRWSTANPGRPSPPVASRPLPGSSTPPRAASPAMMQRTGTYANGGRVISGSGALGAAGDPRRYSLR